MVEDQYNAYKAASHMVRKTKQVVMLYDGAIRSVQQAKAAIESGDIETRYNSLTRACDIINGLQISLDFEKGGEIAQLLYDYYAGIDMRLMSVHQSQDISICDACIDQLKKMREAWDEIDQNSEFGVGENQEEIDISSPEISASLEKAASGAYQTEGHAETHESEDVPIPTMADNSDSSEETSGFSVTA